MKHCRVSAFVRVARVIAYAAVAFGVGAGSLLAQGATGKIEGRVRDQAGAPIANAQVFVVGTAFNALTNPQGYYFINNVPASTVSLRANFIGYKSTQVEGVKVLAGQTITVDVQLEQTAVQLQEITVVQETQPLVPRDEVTTKQRVDGDFVDKLPVDRINQVLQLQPGVSADNAGRLSIRGGRNRESATYVDGVPVQAGYRGDRPFGAQATEISVSTNAVEEASVTTGSSSAEFGNAKSGIVAITTRTGGPQYRGSFGYESDEPFGVNHSVGLNRMQGAFSGPLAGRLTFAVSGTLEGRRAIEDGFKSQDTPIFLQAGVDTVVHQATTLDDPNTEDVVEGVNSDTTLVPVYNYAVSRGRCDAFANSGSAGLGGADSSYINQIRSNFGLDCNGVRLPATARTLYQASGKLNYTYGTGSRLALSVSSSRNAGHAYPAASPIRYYNLLSLNNNLLGFNQRNRVATFNWTQNLAKSAERALALDVALSYQQDRSIQSPLTTESDLSTRDPFGGFILKPMHFMFDFDNFPITDELVTNFRKNQGRFVPFDASNAAQYAVTDQTRNNAYALYGKYGGFFNTLQGENWQFGESGGPASPLRLDLYKEQRYIGKANLDWQVDRYNRVKLGGEFTRYSIDNYSGRLTSKNFDDIYKEKPIRWNGFVEDRLDLGDVVVVGGLRYDYFDSRASRPFVSDTNGNKYAFPRISSYKDVTNNGNLVDTGFDPSNPTGKFVRDKSHNYLSPHVQVSFPVTDRTNFRLSYSHQVQTPDFALLFAGINEDVDLTNTNQVYGTDLDFGKTITFEFGIRHAFSDDMVLDLAAYNKDIISDPAARLIRLYDPVQKADNDFRMLTNLDFGNVRGLDVRLDRRFGNYFNGTVSYSYQQAKNTGSDPFTYIFYNSRIVNQVGGINGAQPPPQGILPTDNSRPHTLAGALSLTFPHDFRNGTALGSVLKDFSVFATFRYASGTAYSKCGETSDAEQSVLSIENCQNLFPEGINTQRLPSYKQFDARFTKGFSLGKLDLTGYLDVRNLLNFKNIVEVFAVTGVPSNAEERKANLQTDLSDLASEGGQNNAITGDGSLDLSFAGAADPRASCGAWVSSQQKPAASNCVYLIRAEERYGDGDHIFTVDEQTRAINALYDAGRGEQVHTEPGRRARLGFEINF